MRRFLVYSLQMKKRKKKIQERKRDYMTPTILFAVIFALYYFGNPKITNFYDYTFRVADALLHGHIGITQKPPSWLNEFVPFNGKWYSVFPLGSVVTMMPFAVAKSLGLIKEMPAAFLSALTAGLSALLLYLISLRYELTKLKRIVLISAIMLGTWTLTNITAGGAWQLALGWAIVGELGAIYFSYYNKKPLLAGLFFALAFGNRTEILITAPIIIYLLLRDETVESLIPKFNKTKFIAFAKFAIVPFILGVLTLLYNHARFGSFSDFGYARIPGVLAEPWYNHGIFSYKYIPRQATEMLLKQWRKVPGTSWRTPDPFSSSILISSPFLLLAGKFGSRDKVLKYLSWLSVVMLTVFLWMHGNSGGWQFGYRYAIILLPWLFVIIIQTYFFRELPGYFTGSKNHIPYKKHITIVAVYHANSVMVVCRMVGMMRGRR